jgi:hypothetical protein
MLLITFQICGGCCTKLGCQVIEVVTIIVAVVVVLVVVIVVVVVVVKNDAFSVWIMWCHLSMHMTTITGISMQDSTDIYSSRNIVTSLTVYSNKYL